MVNVELIYCAADKSITHLKLSLPIGATVANALTKSQLSKRYPEIEQYPIGIFAKQVSKTTVLESGDRIEIYRPLLIDPKDKRRCLAKAKNNR